MTKTKKRSICRLIDIAFQWHGGGGSPLYSFASTRMVHSEEHRKHLIDEISKDLHGIRSDGVGERVLGSGFKFPKGSIRDARALCALRDLIASQDSFSIELVSNEDMGRHWNENERINKIRRTFGC